MNQNHERLIRLGNGILGEARKELYLSMRYLDIALSGLGYRLDLNTAALGTDGVDIHYNSTYLIRLYQDNPVKVNRAYLHMLLHCMFRHELGGGGRDREVWDLACDIAAESVADTLDYPSTALMISALREETYAWLKGEMKVLTAEGIYRALEHRRLSYPELLRLGREFLRDSHQFWPEEPERQRAEVREQSGGGGGTGAEQAARRELEAKWRQIDEKTQTNLETLRVRHGTESAGLMEAIRIENRERYDYGRFLRRFVTTREELHLDTDSFDYAYYNLGLELLGDAPLIEPLEYRDARKIHDLVLVIDTSDSCSDGKIRAFLSETRAILNQGDRFFQRMNLHILQCDAEVQRDTVIHSSADFAQFEREFQVIGFGGTDFRPAFRYVDRLIRDGQLTDLKGLLYFTDGWGTYPEHRPPYDTAFLFFRESYTDTDVPPWAMKVILGPDDLIEETT